MGPAAPRHRSSRICRTLSSCCCRMHSSHRQPSSRGRGVRCLRVRPAIYPQRPQHLQREGGSRVGYPPQRVGYPPQRVGYPPHFPTLLRLGVAVLRMWRQNHGSGRGIGTKGPRGLHVGNPSVCHHRLAGHSRVNLLLAKSAGKAASIQWFAA
jgi:hypothetical protein